MWGEVYPRLVYGCRCEHYSMTIYDAGFKCTFEWVQKNYNCGDGIVVGIPVKVCLETGTTKPPDSDIEKLKAFLAKRPSYKPDLKTMGFYLGVIGYGADEPQGLCLEYSDAEYTDTESEPESDE